MNPNSFVPFPIMALSQPTPQRSLHTGENPPARVIVAMEFLSMLTNKTAVRAVSNELSIEQISGQELTTAERNAQATACNVIGDYLRGTLSPNYWEKEVRTRETKGRGQIVGCFICPSSAPIPSCRFCRGYGTVIVTPTAGGHS